MEQIVALKIMERVVGMDTMFLIADYLKENWVLNKSTNKFSINKKQFENLCVRKMSHTGVVTICEGEKRTKMLKITVNPWFTYYQSINQNEVYLVEKTQISNYDDTEYESTDAWLFDNNGYKFYANLEKPVSYTHLTLPTIYSV